MRTIVVVIPFCSDPYVRYLYKAAKTLLKFVASALCLQRPAISEIIYRISTRKTGTYSIFNGKNTKETKLVQIDGHYIDRVWGQGDENAFKLVGIMIDDQLKWDHHIAYIAKKNRVC